MRAERCCARACVIGFAALGFATGARGTMIGLGPINAQAETADGVFWFLEYNSGVDSLNVARFAGTSLQRRAILEYPLDTIPDDAEITAATLTITIQSFTSNSPVLEFNGYNGNGVQNISDATVPFNLVGATPEITALTSYPVSIHPLFVQALVQGGATHLGLMVYQQTLSGNVSFAVEQGVSPVLQVTYVPRTRRCGPVVDGHADHPGRPRPKLPPSGSVSHSAPGICSIASSSHLTSVARPGSAATCFLVVFRADRASCPPIVTRPSIASFQISGAGSCRASARNPGVLEGEVAR